MRHIFTPMTLSHGTFQLRTRYMLPLMTLRPGHTPLRTRRHSGLTIATPMSFRTKKFPAGLPQMTDQSLQRGRRLMVKRDGGPSQSWTKHSSVHDPIASSGGSSWCIPIVGCFSAAEGDLLILSQRHWKVDSWFLVGGRREVRR